MKRTLATLAAVPVVLAACGAGEAAGPPSVMNGAHADFVAAATQICRGMQKDVSGISVTANATDGQVSRIIERLRLGFGRLAALEPPTQRRAAVERMLKHYRNMTRALDTMIVAEDETVLAAAVGSVVEGQRGSRAAREAGLATCAFFQEIKQPPADRQPMHEATRELVPPGATILRADGADCGAGATPSCRFEYEAGTTGIATRLSDARARLRAHGWTNVRAGRSSPGSRWLMANRNDYAATVEIIGDPLPAHCAQRVAWGCSDSVWVHRIVVPDVLTGG